MKTCQILLLPIAAICLLITSCNKPPSKVDVNPEFTAYISAYTTGVISVASPIIVQLAEPNRAVHTGDPLNEKILSFNPAIEGEALWVDQRTIEFRPKSNLPQATLYEAAFHIHEIREMPADLKTMRFNFQTKEQDIFLNLDGLEYDDIEDLTRPRLNGVARTADVMDLSKLEKHIQATQNGEMLDIIWDQISGAEFAFTINKAVRGEKRSNVFISWKAKDLGVKQDGEENLEIPPLGDMRVMSCKMQHRPSRFLELHFSDPLDAKQDLEGLVQIQPNAEFRMEIRGNRLLLYPNERLTGTRRVIVNQAVKNSQGYEMQTEFNTSITFNNLQPAIEYIGNGTILPSTDGMRLPFRAVNLRAVGVKIIKIYEDNVAYFLQQNDLDGQSDLVRVGRLVYHKEVPLTSDKPIDLGSWNNFALDLSDMISPEPGAIYQVVMGMDRTQSIYPCDGIDHSDAIATTYMDETELSRYDGPQGYYNRYYYNYDSYNWNERDDPCKDSYYMYGNRSISKNILASDLGLIVKGNDANNLKIAVTDIKSTDPLSNVEVEIYDYQNRLIKSGTTGSAGLVDLELNRKPFLLVAKRGKERGYLRLDDGLALSMSMFNVGGEKLVKGVKGFLYGERGVWRPGDSLHLTFILQDELKVLPKNHPVVFELFTPEGQMHQRIVRTMGVNGFYDVSTITNADAPTGNWLGKVKVGGSTFTKTLKIETVKPNRLKIRTDVAEGGVLRGDDQEVNMEVTWLHGAIAKGLKADVEMIVNSGHTTFDGYSDYTFDDPAKRFESEEQMIFDGRLDDQGRASYTADINVSNSAPGMLRASFKTRVFEQGGDISEDRFVAQYSPYDGYVGVKTPQGKGWRGALYSNETNLFSIITLDDAGKKVDRDELIVEVFDVHWRWWWEYDDQYELARYVSNSTNHRIKVDTVGTKNGETKYALKFDNERWGRKLIRITDPQTGHSTGSVFYMSYSGWWNDPSNNPGGAEMLTFKTDKEVYSPGETVSITLPEFKAGRAMVSIESGSEILENFWVTPQNAGKVSFMATAEMTPNVYVNIALLQPHAQVENDLPVRLYGVYEIKVEDPSTHLEPVIDMPKEIQPESTFSIEISEKSGKAMTYTVAVVDEGLLDLTRFKTPEPWKKFYTREALGVRSWDMYKHVIGSFSGEMAGLLALGGDEYVNSEVEKKAQRFKPVVRFIGPFNLDAGGTAVHKITMPNYVGSVRTMVVAGRDYAYGHVEETTPVRKPLMVLASLPRVVGPGEKLKLPVTVFAMDKKIKNVSVKVSGNDRLTFTSGTEKNVSFDEVGDRIVNFDINVAEQLGIATLQVDVRSGNEHASYELEVDVRIPNPPVNELQSAVIKPGETWNGTYQPVGLIGTNSGTLELSSIPPINLEQRLQYLIRYPHGCIEQTTSSVFPQLFLSELMDLDASRKPEIQKNIMAGLERLRQFQTSSGGFSYWPGEAESSVWGSNYGGHYLLEAKARGYALPVGMLDDWVRYQRDQANTWSPAGEGTNRHYHNSNDLIQAYRLYTLALAGKPVKGAMNRMRELRNLSPAARWRLAAAYQLISRQEIAQELIAQASTDVQPYRELGNSYGSDVRDRAMILETMALMKSTVRGKSILDELCKSIGNDSWYSTQTTAYTLMAIAKFVGNSGAGEATLRYTWNMDGKSSSNATESVIAQHSIENVDATNQVKVTNTGEKTIFLKLSSSGIPLVGDQTDESNDLLMSVEYFTMTGTPLNISCLEQGTDIVAEVLISHPGVRQYYQEMALTQIFPSGWEIRNTRMDLAESSVVADKPDYQDIRDDRVYSYFDLGRGQTVRYRTILNAAYLGTFYLPTVYCEAMYDNDINARVAGQWVDVKPAGSSK
jgi:uncharacterized protein YfaS (alpha-2-macroglobulin family)